jgi:peroxiredoxin
MVVVCLSPPVVRAGTYNPDRNIGDVVPAWTGLPGCDGQPHGWQEFAERDYLVVVFTCNSCPYAVDYEDRIQALARRASLPESRFALVAINANLIPEDALPAMRRRAEQRGFSFPYLFDETQTVSRSFGAVRTPEFFILDRQRRIVYMGSYDDHEVAAQVSKRYVEEALAALLAARPVPVAETPPIGCMIRYQRTRRGRASQNP